MSTGKVRHIKAVFHRGTYHQVTVEFTLAADDERCKSKRAVIAYLEPMYGPITRAQVDISRPRNSLTSD